MTDNPFISIIVASYNYEKYIKRTLDSLINQSYKNYEIIVIDDGSRDKSIEIILEYVKIYPQKIFLYQHPNQENKGLIETLTLGVKKAKGQWISFCESDDFWEKNHLEQKVNFFKKHPYAHIIGCSVYCIGDYLLSYRRSVWINQLEHILVEKNSNFFKEMLIGNKIPTFSCWMARTEDLLKLNFIDCPIPFSLDYWLTLQLTYRYDYYFLNAKLTFWQQHADSYFIREGIQKIEKDKKVLIEKLLKILKD